MAAESYPLPQALQLTVVVRNDILPLPMYWNITDKERLLRAFESASQDRKLLENFLSDILTEKEIEQCATRLKTACLFFDGASYEQIRAATSLGPSTISRLSKRFSSKESSFSKIIKKFASQGESYFD